MFLQVRNRSTTIRRISLGYRPTRLFGICSSFPAKCALGECLNPGVHSTKWYAGPGFEHGIVRRSHASYEKHLSAVGWDPCCLDVIPMRATLQGADAEL